MKRLTRPARYRAANKAQENPYGTVVVALLFLGALLLSARPVFGRTTAQNKQFATIDAYARACHEFDLFLRFLSSILSSLLQCSMNHYQRAA